jgi:hypothetical protein
MDPTQSNGVLLLSVLDLFMQWRALGPAAADEQRTAESVVSHAVLRCAALCCAVLCCAVLCCAVLCCAVLCCAVLCCAVLCCAVLCCAGGGIGGHFLGSFGNLLMPELGVGTDDELRGGRGGGGSAAGSLQLHGTSPSECRVVNSVTSCTVRLGGSCDLLQVDGFSAEGDSPHQITRHSS